VDVGVECRLERPQVGAVGAVSGALVLVDAGICSGVWSDYRYLSSGVNSPYGKDS
jgi:hypothetical protein